MFFRGAPVDVSLSLLLFFVVLDCFEDLLRCSSHMEKEYVPPAVLAADFQSGYDTNFNYFDDDVIRSGGESVRPVSGW